MIITPSNRIKHIKPYYFADKMAQIAEMNSKGYDVINIGIGSPDLSPDKKVVDRLITASKDSTNHGYQSYRGLTELRKGFSDWYSRNFGIEIDANDEIQVLAGSKEGIMHIAMSFLNKGDFVLVPDPGYPTYTAASLLAGADIIKYNLLEKNDWLPDFKKIEENDLSKVKIMWINYPHMPTGARGTKELFLKLISFAKKHKILLVNDNPYNFILNDSPLSILGFEGAKEVAVELVSLSKTFNMAGWRIGALAGDKKYIDEVIKFKSNMDSGMFKPVQLAGAEALNLDTGWLDKMNHIYNERKQVVREIMDILNCKYDKKSTGMFVWGKINNSNEDGELVEQILQNAKVFITPGRIFGENGKGYLRISLTNSIEKLQEAKNRIMKHYIGRTE